MVSMNLEWISQKGTSLTAIVIGLGFAAIAFVHSQYRYFYLCVAIVALVYGYKQFRRRDTPFERREREMRRKTM
jgi:4-hydroxybenzoate polyprenyltransferase